MEFPCRDVELLNRKWRDDSVGRFNKRRDLSWVTADDLLAIHETPPERLWKLVGQLEHAPNLIRNIVRKREAGNR
ncbi:MAG: hypothetical protein KUF77_16485 [Candidatus Thiodiazotropha sp. (ex Lucina aurantia)]|nr:hypothetical protein [Candidatus Thiodiazotropha sp. (ex Lucina pensylvanica)]MBT3024788.1 hypothetical protein [Candidatus Thiodiazotropha taylori]MBV2104623.1 hypothetical protein [Candidatus Thiodiazotropha sp. (ex Lucina aurantia)]MCG8092024.1 hypothetical protein [Candidatus Thiodiazotropha endolucinida]MCG8046869.1 hypothetical protein [Candidatus Thiodiazotropha taylori]